MKTSLIVFLVGLVLILLGLNSIDLIKTLAIESLIKILVIGISISVGLFLVLISFYQEI